MTEKCNCNNGGSYINGMLLGLVVGGALGVLLAPESGTKTRKKVRKVGDKYLAQGREVYDAASEKYEHARAMAKPVLDELEKSLGPLLELAKDASPEIKAQILEKVDSLVSDKFNS